MEQIAIVRRYFTAWNRHDPAGVARAFVEGSA